MNHVNLLSINLQDDHGNILIKFCSTATLAFKGIRAEEILDLVGSVSGKIWKC